MTGHTVFQIQPASTHVWGFCFAKSCICHFFFHFLFRLLQLARALCQFFLSDKGTYMRGSHDERVDRFFAVARSPLCLGPVEQEPFLDKHLRQKMQSTFLIVGVVLAKTQTGGDTDFQPGALRSWGGFPETIPSHCIEFKSLWPMWRFQGWGLLKISFSKKQSKGLMSVIPALQ